MTADTPRRSNTPTLRPNQMDSIQAAMETLDELPPPRPPVTLEKLRAFPGMPDEHIDATNRRFTRANAVHEWLPPSLDSEKVAHDQATVDRLRKIRQVLEETVDALEVDGAHGRR